MALTKEQFHEAMDLVMSSPETRATVRDSIDQIDGPALTDEQKKDADQVKQYMKLGMTEDAAKRKLELDRLMKDRYDFIKMPGDPSAPKPPQPFNGTSPSVDAFARGLKIPA